MPESHRQLFPSVDDKKALEQLEKFQREIQSARWKREQASAEFESFVKGFGGETAPENSAARSAEQPRASTPAVVRAVRRHSLTTPPHQPEQHPPARPAIARTEHAPAPPPLPAPVLAAEPAAANEETESYSTRLQRWRGTALVGAALVAIVLLAIGWWKNMPTETPGEAGAATVATAPATAEPAAAPQATAPVTIPPPAAATPPVAQPAATLTASRRVWVRVMADGHRMFERELTAGEHVPLDATQAIVIRVGDAGAVRITFADGRTETLGAEGQVVTKRYELRTRN